jgi:hypothetical protein
MGSSDSRWVAPGRPRRARPGGTALGDVRIDSDHGAVLTGELGRKNIGYGAARSLSSAMPTPSQPMLPFCHRNANLAGVE